MGSVFQRRVARVCHAWAATADLFDQLIRSDPQGLRDRQAEGLRRFHWPLSRMSS